MSKQKSSKLFFSSAEVRELVEHSTDAPEQGKFFGEPVTEPSLFFVHDEGVYLMSNGVPHLPGTDTMHKVAYALGLNPRENPGYWDLAAELVGGDDFGEVIECSAFAEVLDFRYVVILINDDTYRIGGADRPE